MTIPLDDEHAWACNGDGSDATPDDTASEAGTMTFEDEIRDVGLQIVREETRRIITRKQIKPRGMDQLPDQMDGNQDTDTDEMVFQDCGRKLHGLLVMARQALADAGRYSRNWTERFFVWYQKTCRQGTSYRDIEYGLDELSSQSGSTLPGARTCHKRYRLDHGTAQRWMKKDILPLIASTPRHHIGRRIGSSVEQACSRLGSAECFASLVDQFLSVLADAFEDDVRTREAPRDLLFLVMLHLAQTTPIGAPSCKYRLHHIQMSDKAEAERVWQRMSKVDTAGTLAVMAPVMICSVSDLTRRRK